MHGLLFGDMAVIGSKTGPPPAPVIGEFYVATFASVAPAVGVTIGVIATTFPSLPEIENATGTVIEWYRKAPDDLEPYLIDGSGDTREILAADQGTNVTARLVASNAFWNGAPEDENPSTVRISSNAITVPAFELTSSGIASIGNNTNPARIPPYLGDSISLGGIEPATNNGETPNLVRYFWMRDDGSGAVEIAGATLSSYTIILQDVGKSIAGYVEYNTILHPSPVSFGAGTTPEPGVGVPSPGGSFAIEGVPEVSGNVEIGAVITATGSGGFLDHDPAEIIYIFKVTSGGSQVTVQESASNTYTVLAVDGGGAISCTVKLVNAVYKDANAAAGFPATFAESNTIQVNMPASPGLSLYIVSAPWLTAGNLTAIGQATASVVTAGVATWKLTQDGDENIIATGTFGSVEADDGDYGIFEQAFDFPAGAIASAAAYTTFKIWVRFNRNGVLSEWAASAQQGVFTRVPPPESAILDALPPDAGYVMLKVSIVAGSLYSDFLDAGGVGLVGSFQVTITADSVPLTPELFPLQDTELNFSVPVEELATKTFSLVTVDTVVPSFTAITG